MQSAEPNPHLRSERTLPLRKVWLLSWMVEGCALVFSALVVGAMSLYPGGTFWDRSAEGHSFWQNFLCDLIQSPALGGAANVLGAKLATVGMLVLVAGMVAFVGIVPALLSETQQLTRQVRTIVTGACVTIACVPLLPSDRFGALHAAAIFAAGIPVSIALTVLVVALARQMGLSRWLRVLSISLCVVVNVSLVLYAAEVFFDSAPLRIVPTLSRLANVGLIAWLVGLSHVARARALSAQGASHGLLSAYESARRTALDDGRETTP